MLQRESFNLVGDRRMRPCRQLRVVQGDQRVGDNRRLRDAGIEEAEVARVGHLHRIAAKEIGNLAGQVREWDRPGEIAEPRLELSSKLPGLDRRGHGQLTKMVDERLNFPSNLFPDGHRCVCAHSAFVPVSPQNRNQHDATEVQATKLGALDRRALHRTGRSQRPFA
jgi:hypothetical protein